jgi:hypothetical protein
MDSRTLGFGYSFALRGQNITSANAPSNEVLHQAVLGYAPIPYLSLQAGLGFDRFSVDANDQVRFRGDYGLANSVGATAYSPAFAMDYLRASLGAHFLFLKSEDGRGFRYSAVVSSPHLGLIVSPTVYIDVGAGARGHFVNGGMESPREEKDFANADIGRGYLSVTLKSPYERAFLHFDVDFSPEVDMDWSDGPREASISLSVGALIGWRGKSREKDPGEKPIYFPAYPEMKDRQEKMAEELE